MNAEKAIGNLALIHDTPPSGATLDFTDAVKLGEEALKVVERDRNLGMPWAIQLLPGETED